MKLLGAKVNEVSIGSRTLKDAINEALRDWTTNVGTTHYVMGTVFGPYPYPEMVRDFQAVIGQEAIRQIKEAEGRMPDFLVACVGGGSNSIGLFHKFLTHKSGILIKDIQFIGVEAGGFGVESGKHAARFAGGCVGVFQGCKSYLLQDDDGNVLGTHSVSAGLDYASVGPEHAFLHDAGIVKYTHATDDEALKAFAMLAKTEGIICALESAHAVAHVIKLAPTLSKNKIIIVNLSGRGDKDVQQVSELNLEGAALKPA
jgi:tryptophan synthase beta chain